MIKIYLPRYAIRKEKNRPKKASHHNSKTDNFYFDDTCKYMYINTPVSENKGNPLMGLHLTQTKYHPDVNRKIL